MYIYIHLFCYIYIHIDINIKYIEGIMLHQNRDSLACMKRDEIQDEKNNFSFFHSLRLSLNLSTSKRRSCRSILYRRDLSYRSSVRLQWPPDWESVTSFLAHTLFPISLLDERWNSVLSLLHLTPSTVHSHASWQRQIKQPPVLHSAADGPLSGQHFELPGEASRSQPIISNYRACQSLFATDSFKSKMRANWLCGLGGW